MLPKILQLTPLTSKGLNVHTADKPVLVSVTWAHTIFRFFETFCKDASRSNLCGKKKSYFFGPTDQKLWVFEVSRRSLGRAGMCWSQPARVDHLGKKWRAERNKFQKKWGQPNRAKRRPAASGRPLVAAHGSVGQGRAATISRPPTAGRCLALSGCPHFFIFLFLKIK
jgi:hypothetical protein